MPIRLKSICLLLAAMFCIQFEAQAGVYVEDEDDFRIMPMLSAPSVKNGGTLKISAGVYAKAGVLGVVAEIKDGARVIDAVTLEQSADPSGAVQWSADWTAKSLEENQYTVALSVTDAAGRTHVDESLSFSDPVAGITAPGSGAVPNAAMRRVGALTMASGESKSFCAVVDHAAGFAYFGLETFPGKVVKVRLSDMTPVATLTMNNGENALYCGAIDPAGGYAYFGSYTPPGPSKVIRVKLSDFTRDAVLTLNSGEDFAIDAAIDVAGGGLYLGTATSPGQIIKVNLADFTRAGAITLNPGEGAVASSLVAPLSGFAYFGTSDVQAKVIKIRLSDFTRFASTPLASGDSYLNCAVMDAAEEYAYFGSGGNQPRAIKVKLSDLSRVDAVPVIFGEGSFLSAVIEPSGRYAYFGTIDSPGKIVKVRLTEFLREGAITLNAGESDLKAAVIDARGENAVFATHTLPSIAVKVSLSQKGFAKAVRFTMPEPGTPTNVKFYRHEAEGNMRLAIYDDESPARHLLWSSNSTANTVPFSNLTIQRSSGTPSAAQLLLKGYYWLAWQTDSSAVIPSYSQGAPGDGFYLTQAYGEFPSSIDAALPASTDERWTTSITYDASDPAAGFTTPGSPDYNAGGPKRVATSVANTGDNGYACMVVDSVNGFAYFGTNTSPGKIVKVRLGDFARVGTLTLNTGENSLRCAVMNPATGLAYFGTATSPGQIVIVNLANFTRVRALVGTAAETSYVSAAADLANGFAYFGTDSTPGIVLKLNLADSTRVGLLPLSAGEDRLFAAAINPASKFAYFGTLTTPGKVVRISLSGFIHAGAVTLPAGTGQDAFRSAAADPAGGHVYFGSNVAPGRVTKIRESDFTALSPLTLNAGENNLLSAAIDPLGGNLFFGTGSTPARVVQVRLSDFTRMGGQLQTSGDNSLICAAVDATRGFLLFGANTSPGRALKFTLHQVGYIKATHFAMSEEGRLKTANLFSHAAAGKVRLAVYDDDPAMRHLLWQSPSTSTSANDYVRIAAEEGLPTQGPFLETGNYWLAWQADSASAAPSYSQRAAGEGFYLTQSYGAFPEEIDPAAASGSDEKWTSYITYDPNDAAPLNGVEAEWLGYR